MNLVQGEVEIQNCTHFDKTYYYMILLMNLVQGEVEIQNCTHFDKASTLN
jgi:hypothetical protein